MMAKRTFRRDRDGRWVRTSPVRGKHLRLRKGVDPNSLPAKSWFSRGMRTGNRYDEGTITWEDIEREYQAITKETEL
jgi:hypothetical protein